MRATTGAVWQAASKDEMRPVLTAVRFDADKGTLAATNSYIAACVPCEVEEGDESGLIPAEAVREAKRNSLRIADGKATLQLPGGERTWKLIEGTFPDLDKIIAETPALDYPFGVNARLLADLSRAIAERDDSPAVLHPIHPHKGILVTSPNGASGVIMTVKLADRPFSAVPANGHPNLTDDEAVIVAVQAAYKALKSRRGKRRAAQAFRAALQVQNSQPRGDEQ